MAWFRVDDEIYHHPKILSVSAESAWLFVASGAYCAKYKTDGKFPKQVITGLTASRSVEASEKALVRAGLWEEADQFSYRIPNYLKYNPSREQLEIEAAKQRDRRDARRTGDERASVSGITITPTPDVPSEHLSSAKPSSAAYESDFDEWWSDYPRKVNKAQSFKAYKARRREGVSHQTLMDARDAYALTRAGEPQEFTLHGATFLAKGGRWSEVEPILSGPLQPLDATDPFDGPPSEPRLVLPPASYPTCPVCESSMLACVCGRN